MKNELFYNSSPKDWNEALPLGNGILGAMMFGDVKKERIQLNEDSLWSGGQRKRVNKLSKDSFKAVREKIEKGELQNAEQLAKETMLTYFPHMTHYQTAGDIWFEDLTLDIIDDKDLEKDEMGIPRIKEQAEMDVKKYSRKLNLQKGLWENYYIKGDQEIHRKAFISSDENILAYQMSGKDLSYLIHYNRRDLGNGKNASYIDEIYTIDDQIIIGSGHNGSIESGIGYAVAIKVCQDGGEQKSNGSGIIVKNAENITIYVSIHTTFRVENPLNKSLNSIENKTTKDFDQLVLSHEEVHSELYDRFEFSLEDDEEDYSVIPIDEKINQLKENNKYLNDLTQIFVNYGKYLLISSSNGNSLPSNLQGIWNPDIDPSWGSKYTLNVNTQMNYSFALQMNLPETIFPLLNHLKRMLPNGKKVAKKMYGIDGFVCHHVTDIWGDCAPQDHNLAASIWPMGGAWLSLYIWKAYQYENDINILQEYFEVLNESVIFFNNYLFLNKKNEWVTGPSASPENYYLTEDKAIASLDNGPTMDSQIVRDLFEAYLEAIDILDFNSDIKIDIEQKLEKLPKNRITHDGRVQEWSRDYIDIDKGHRHVSHLYGLHPSKQISRNNEELIEASRETLLKRLEHGGGHTSWSAAWILNLWNRIGDKNQAKEGLITLLNASYNNMLSKHPPFQIDGNFGGTEGIIQFFIQEEKDKLLILPNIIPEFKAGKIKGFKSIHGVMIDMEWSQEELDKIILTAYKDTTITVSIYEKNDVSEKEYKLKNNDSIKIDNKKGEVE